MLTKSCIAAASLLAALAVGATAQAEPHREARTEPTCKRTSSTAPGQREHPRVSTRSHNTSEAAWHLTDSRQIFVGLIGFDETANTLVILTPGFERNAVAAVTCRSVRASSGHVFRVTGVLTPAASR